MQRNSNWSTLQSKPKLFEIVSSIFQLLSFLILLLDVDNNFFLNHQLREFELRKTKYIK